MIHGRRGLCQSALMAQDVCPLVSAEDRVRLEAIVAVAQPRLEARDPSPDHARRGRLARRRRDRPPG